MMSMGASPLRYPRRRRSTQADGHGHRRRRCAIHPVAALLLVVGATNDRGGRQNRSGIWRALPCVRVEAASAAASRPSGRPNVLVVGSMNLDTILSVDRLPVEGENLTVLRDSHPTCDVPGGKGCNQAIAASRLMREEKDDDEGEKKDGRGGGETKTKPVGRSVSFVGQFGCDASGAKILRRALLADGVDVSGCGQCRDAPCGRGYVFLVARTGSVSAVVSGGSNVEGWWSPPNERGECDVGGEWARRMRKLVRSRSVVMLQREIPEHVNLCVARAAAAAREEKGGGWPIVMQDVGGEDRPMSSEMMSLCDYLVPNRSELARLVRYFSDDDDERGADEHDDEDEDVDDARIVEWCRLLQDRGGANHVLVTLGSRGSILVPLRSDSSILRQPPCPLPDGTAVVDETCAGDCYRAALAVGLSEGMTARRAMEFASAAGAVAVTRVGAAPSIPTRGEVDDLRRRHFGEDGVAEGGAGGVVDGNVAATSPGATSVRGGGEGGGDDDLNATGGDDDDEECPLMFGSRLNSMKDRPDLWDGPPLDDPRMWVKRQGTIRGLGCVDFNYPQHFHGWTNAEAKQALDEAGLVAGAVCLRYPHHRFQLGAMTHPDPAVRREAIDLTKQAAQTALDLGCSEVVVWSAYDGYDYPFQVDYDDKWGQIVDAFRECCDAFPDVKFSLEYKPTDENTRFFAVPSTGAAVLLVREVDRPNMGLTLDVGHMLMSGENPAQSIAMAGSKLFGVQLNDGYTRLAAEDGMMFGSVHPNMALEAIYHLQRIKYRGHLYFDTFPQRTDPVREAEYNIRKVKEFWRAARRLDSLGIRDVMASHDALGALERTEDAFAFALARDGGGRGGNED